MKKQMCVLGLIILSTLACRTRESDPKKITPEPSIGVVKTETDFVKGNAQGKIKIEYFADLQCGACKALSPKLDEILVEHADQVKLVFKNYPKDKSCTNYEGKYLHEFSCEAAIAARCVGLNNGKFWEFKDHLFANQSTYSLANFKSWAAQFGLANASYDTCFNDPAIIARIKSDVAEGINRGVVGTPTIFVNGTKITQPTKELIKAEIQNHL